MEYLQEAVGRKTAFNVTLYQTKKTPTSASYVVKVNRNGTKFFGELKRQINVLHDDGSGFKNIIISSDANAGVHDPKDRGAELLRWCFPEQSAWKWGYIDDEWKWYLTNNNKTEGLSHYFWTSRQDGTLWGDKRRGWVTGSTIYSKEYTVNIDRGLNKKAYKTVKAKIKGTSSTGDFGDIEVSMSLETTEVSSATIDAFTVTQSDKNSKDRKITVDIKITNPEEYYTLIVKHNNIQINKGQEKASEICIDIPITREMYDSTQTFSATILCANGETEVPETIRKIYIENTGIGITYKEKSNKLKEVEEVWYKDKDGNISEVTEVWVKKGKQVVKTIK